LFSYKSLQYVFESNNPDSIADVAEQPICRNDLKSEIKIKIFLISDFIVNFFR